jgi:membrane protein YdbS with pleckstrin-like domain
MSPKTHRQQRMNVLLQMVMALITAILLGQLWLFTVALDAMESTTASTTVSLVAVICSLLACGAVWVLIRFFLNTERAEAGERS